MPGRNLQVCQTYALIPRCRRICPQCTIPTEEFNLHHSPEHVDQHVRRLDDMLVLPNAQRQEYSFLCAGEGWLHGPLAIATVDPAVLRLDMDCAPPDRWHGVVDMIDDLTGAVRAGLKKRKLAKVWARAQCRGSGGDGRPMRQLNLRRSGQRRARAGHI